MAEHRCSLPRAAWTLALLLAACAGGSEPTRHSGASATVLPSEQPLVGAVNVPPEGACPPYPVEPGLETPDLEDAAPPRFEPGAKIDFSGLAVLHDYLPPEVWQRREIFFYEGMSIEIGPCHRRYPVPEFFARATQENANRARLDEDGNLLEYSGQGLPFSPSSINLEAPDAGARWAWSYRYRYMGAGLRGEFRITHVMRRGEKTEDFRGEFFLLPLHGYPGAQDDADDDESFWAGGSFDAPALARGLAWRQVRKTEVDHSFDRADDVWVWLPDMRRVRRAGQFAVEGLYMPSYTRGQQAGGGQLQLPDGSGGSLDVQVGATEHSRRGFVGLMIRPNAYRFEVQRVQDVIAPINIDYFGYPQDPERSWGPSGLSVATGRWEIRRAVVLHGQRKESSDNIGSLTLYVDALTQAPLYLITRRITGAVLEVGIFVGRFTADDPLAAHWAGSGADFGALLPTAQTFFVAGDEGWIRESFELSTEPASEDERRDFMSVQPLQRRGR